MTSLAHGSSVIPSAVESCDQATIRDTSKPGGFSHRETLPMHNNVAIVSLVVGLCHSRRPDAILRRVIAGVVFALDSVAGWARAHIGVEGGEVIQPSMAHCDSAASVISIPDVLRVRTSLFSVYPGIEFSGVPLAVRAVVSVSEATAGLLSRFSGQAITSDDSRRPAITHAEPPGVLVSHVGACNYP